MRPKGAEDLCDYVDYELHFRVNSGAEYLILANEEGVVSVVLLFCFGISISQHIPHPAIVWNQAIGGRKSLDQ
jgi:hypothetical protein